MPAPRTTVPAAKTRRGGSRQAAPAATREAALRTAARQAAARQAALEQAARQAAARQAGARAAAARRAAAGSTASRSTPRTPARRVTAQRPPLTPQEEQALRAALAARAAGRGSRTAAGRPSPGRRPAPARRSKRRRTPLRARVRGWVPAAGRRRWRARLSLAALGLVLPVLAGLVAPGTQAPGTAAEPTDPSSLALTAQRTLLDGATRYRELQQDLAARRAELQVAREAEQAAQAQVVAARTTVGTQAAALYRASTESRQPLLELTLQDPSSTADVLYRAALADRAGRDLETSVVQADRAAADLERATQRVAVAEAAVATAERQAAAVLGEVRRAAGGLRTDVAAQLAGLGTGPAAGAQQETNQQALRRWREHLGLLAAAGLESPPAAALADPAALPAGLSPALDSAGQPIPGIAWAVAGNRPVTVLPAETVAAVSSALAQVGKPYVPGGVGPDAYDCGGLAAASWLLAGYALPLEPADQWTSGAAVPASQVQIGDLVFADGGTDVGIYVGEGQVVAASAAGYQVGIRSLAETIGAVRVTLPGPAQPNASLPAGTAGRGPCGAPPPPVGPVSPAWGGWTNGGIPATALCPIARGHALRCDAAASYRALADAFAQAFGRPLCITDSYRSLAAQVTAFRAKPALAAVPGTSNHGWALAVDLCGGINVAGTAQSAWMAANAGRFGFVQPDWARPGGEKPEPWHWEFGLLA